ncbi:HD domain-containing protein [Lachnospiraceae bacterium 46-61]
MLEKAIILAAEAHKGQKDKGGECYILHALRVMLCFNKEEQQIVAVLHDVLEDTKISEEYLQNIGFSKNIIEAVVCLTKRQYENYFDYIERIKQNDIARAVKLADLQDNMNLKRIKNITQKDMERVEKYKKAKKILEM